MIPPEFFDRDLVRFPDTASGRGKSACPRSGICSLALDWARARARRKIPHTCARDNHTYARYERTNKVRWSLGRWPDAGLDQTSASGAESRGRRDGTDAERDRERERKGEKTSIYARKKRETWKFIRAKNGHALMKRMRGNMYIKKK